MILSRRWLFVSVVVVALFGGIDGRRRRNPPRQSVPYTPTAKDNDYVVIDAEFQRVNGKSTKFHGIRFSRQLPLSAIGLPGTYHKLYLLDEDYDPKHDQMDSKIIAYSPQEATKTVGQRADEHAFGYPTRAVYSSGIREEMKDPRRLLYVEYENAIRLDVIDDKHSCPLVPFNAHETAWTVLKRCALDKMSFHSMLLHTHPELVIFELIDLDAKTNTPILNAVNRQMRHVIRGLNPNRLAIHVKIREALVDRRRL